MYSRLWQYLAKFFLEWEMLGIKVVEKIKIYILRPITFSRKSCRLWDNVKKLWWSQRGHKWRHSITHTRCTLYKQDYTHVRVSTRPRSRATTHARTRAHTQTSTYYLLLFHGNNDSRTRLIVKLYVYCLSCTSQIVMKFEFSRHIFEKFSNIKCNENPSSGSRICSIRTEGQTNMKKLIFAFCRFANAP
jgi:hypothetical protein